MSQTITERAYSRREMLGGAGAALVAAGLAQVGLAQADDQPTAVHVSTADVDVDVSDITNLIDMGIENEYYGLEHPVGLQPKVWPREATFVQFDLNDRATVKDIQVLLATWTAAASLLQAGRPLGKTRPDKPSAVPGDSGECMNLYPANLTITIGLGPKLFAQDRYGFEKYKPADFAELPRITDDRFNASEQGSDFGMWIKGDDKQVIFHAVRALARIARLHKCSLTWTHSGYLSARQNGKPGTSRGPHGFIVGLTGVGGDDQYEKYVWIKDSDQEWVNGGSYMVYRDTRFHIDTWDIDRISDQEICLGRRKDTGAPLSNPDGNCFDEPDYDAVDADGNYLIERNAHIRLVSEKYLGFKCFDDGYRYWRGMNSDGTQDAGFVNVLFVNDLQHFITMRDGMGKYDLAKEYYWDTRSATYLIPPQPEIGHYVGEQLFADEDDE